jgi:hypothetical protein
MTKEIHASEEISPTAEEVKLETIPPAQTPIMNPMKPLRPILTVEEIKAPPKTKQSLLSMNEMVILAQSAALNDLRWKNATRDAHVNELESDERKERGLRERTQQKNDHLQQKSISGELADVESVPVSRSGWSGKAVAGILFVGILFGYALATLVVRF